MKRLMVQMKIVLGTLLALSGSAGAQEALEIQWEGHSLTRYFQRAEEKKGDNKIGVVESLTSLNAKINPQDSLTWLWGFQFKHVFIDNNSRDIDLPATLVGREMPVGLTVPLAFVNDDRYRAGVAVIPAYYTDAWKDSFKDFETSAFRWLSEYWVEFAGTNKLSWKLGVRLRPDFDLKVLPVVGLNYQFNERWAFRLTSDDTGFVYSLSPKTKIFSEHRYVLDEYEISQAGRQGRVLRHKQNTTGFGVEHQLDDHWTVKAATGMAYNRSFLFVDDPKTKAVLDEAMYYTVEIIAKF